VRTCPIENISINGFFFTFNVIWFSLLQRQSVSSFSTSLYSSLWLHLFPSSTL
jgi:hypothetical protein